MHFIWLLFIALLIHTISVGQNKPTARNNYKFSSPYYLKKMHSRDSLTIDTSVIYVSMIKQIEQKNNRKDTTYHVYRFFNNGVFYSKNITTKDSLIREMNHPCIGGKWGMYTLDNETIIMESEEKVNNKFQRKYTHGIINENELYLDFYKIGKRKIMFGRENTFTTYLKTSIVIKNWHICWQRNQMNF